MIAWRISRVMFVLPGGMVNDMEPWIESVIVPPADVTVRFRLAEIGEPPFVPTQLSSGPGDGIPGDGHIERKSMELAFTGEERLTKNDRLAIIPAA